MRRTGSLCETDSRPDPRHKNNAREGSDSEIIMRYHALQQRISANTRTTKKHTARCAFLTGINVLKSFNYSADNTLWPLFPEQSIEDASSKAGAEVSAQSLSECSADRTSDSLSDFTAYCACDSASDRFGGALLGLSGFLRLSLCLALFLFSLLGCSGFFFFSSLGFLSLFPRTCRRGLPI